MFVIKGYMFKNGECIDISGMKCSGYEMLPHIIAMGFDVDGYLCTLIEQQEEE